MDRQVIYIINGNITFESKKLKNYLDKPRQQGETQSTFASTRTNCLHVVYGGEPLQMLCNLHFTIHNRLHKLAVKLTMTARYQTDRFETKKWSAVN